MKHLGLLVERFSFGASKRVMGKVVVAMAATASSLSSSSSPVSYCSRATKPLGGALLLGKFLLPAFLLGGGLDLSLRIICPPLSSLLSKGHSAMK